MADEEELLVSLACKNGEGTFRIPYRQLLETGPKKCPCCGKPHNYGQSDAVVNPPAE